MYIVINIFTVSSINCCCS